MKDILQSRQFDFNADPGNEPVIIRIENKNIGSLQNFIGITGLPKNGKGKFASAIAAAAISRQEVFNIRVKLPDGRPRIAWIATDENKYDLHKTINLIKQLAGTADINDRLDVFNVRQDDGKNIIALVDAYLKKFGDCSLIFIDNIADLLINYNDETQSKKIINLLKFWTDQFNVLFIAVLHTGKGNNTTLGHLGAGLDRYAQSILKVQKDKERKVYTLTGDMLRSAPEFTPIDIYYDNNVNGWRQTWHIEESQDKLKAVISEPAELERSYHRQKVQSIFNAGDVIDFDTMIESIKIHYGKPATWAKKCVTHLANLSLITITPGGLRQATEGQQKLKIT